MRPAVSLHPTWSTPNCDFIAGKKNVFAGKSKGLTSIGACDYVPTEIYRLIERKTVHNQFEAGQVLHRLDSQ